MLALLTRTGVTLQASRHNSQAEYLEHHRPHYDVPALYELWQQGLYCFHPVNLCVCVIVVKCGPGDTCCSWDLAQERFWAARCVGVCLQGAMNPSHERRCFTIPPYIFTNDMLNKRHSGNELWTGRLKANADLLVCVSRSPRGPLPSPQPWSGRTRLTEEWVWALAQVLSSYVLGKAPRCFWSHSCRLAWYIHTFFHRW